MARNPYHLFVCSLVAAVVVIGAANAQTASNTQAVPRVFVPTGSRAPEPRAPQATASLTRYPWKTQVTCTIFWIGEQATERNPTPNNKSSWDQQWETNYGGYDDPDPAKRIANFTTGDFRPKGFIPKLNPFYVALPYNDVVSSSSHKPEASRVIPWFARMRPEPGKTVCKGRWLQIYRAGRSCFGQWEDCGPWETDDWEFVFGTQPPKTTQHGSSGINLSPAIRDYLGVKSGDKVHWRFVEAAQVPFGPWKKYATPEAAVAATSSNAPDLAAQQRYLDSLKRLRDEQFLKKPLR